MKEDENWVICWLNLNQELLTKFTYMCRERTIQINGSYLFESGENIDNYLKAVGCPATNVESSLKSYKIEVSFLNETFGTKEWMNGQAISNSMKLDVETPIRYPDDKEGDEFMKSIMIINFSLFLPNCLM